MKKDVNLSIEGETRTAEETGRTEGYDAQERGRGTPRGHGWASPWDAPTTWYGTKDGRTSCQVSFEFPISLQ